MTAAQGRLADTIDKFYGAADRNSEGAMAGHAYKRAVDDLDSGVIRELVRSTNSTTTPGLTKKFQDAPYRTTILEPVGKMCAYFPIINDTIAKREKKVLTQVNNDCVVG